jgi:hypothetical protein
MGLIPNFAAHPRPRDAVHGIDRKAPDVSKPPRAASIRGCLCPLTEVTVNYVITSLKFTLRSNSIITRIENSGKQFPKEVGGQPGRFEVYIA